MVIKLVVVDMMDMVNMADRVNVNMANRVNVAYQHRH